MKLRERLRSDFEELLDEAGITDVAPRYGSIAIELKFEDQKVVLQVKNRQTERQISRTSERN